jgi:hypothetical protein
VPQLVVATATANEDATALIGEDQVLNLHLLNG